MTLIMEGRRVELFCIVSVVGILTVGAITFITYRHNKLPDYSEWCGPETPEFSIDITGARQDGRGFRTSEGLYFPLGTFWKKGNTVFGCPCSIKPCIRKCCSRNEALNGATCTYSTSPQQFFMDGVLTQFNVVKSLKDLQPQSVQYDHFFIVSGDKCDNQIISPPVPLEDYLLMDGRRLTIYDNIATYTDQSQYCLEVQSGSNIVNIVECIQGEVTQLDWIWVVKIIGMLASVIFLLVTFLVYAALPPLRNLHGKALMCHLACLIVAYLAVPINQLVDLEYIKSISLCNALAGVTQFSLVACFFWLNVMCFDIWWIFSGASSFHLKGMAAQKAERLRFIIYSVYAWTGALLISALTFFMDKVPWIPIYYIKPHFGADSCWFYDNEAKMLYFYLPIGLLLYVNLSMFTTTAYRLRTHAKRQAMLKSVQHRSQDSPDRKRFKLYLKLFLVMGLNWVIEILAFIFEGNSLIWLVADLATTLQGITIFIMFVCKQRIWIMLRQKFSKSEELTTPVSSSSRPNRLSYNTQSSGLMQITHI